MINKNKRQCECKISEQEVSISAKNTNDKILNIRWQRLISEGETCPRCGSTEEALEEAIYTLEKSLTPLGIEINLEKEELSVSVFKKDPLQSNRIWVNNRPLEDYIAGEVGQSPCCDVCGPSECRTIEIEGQVYESIPPNIIIQAGLVAAAQLINTKKKGSCCEENGKF